MRRRCSNAWAWWWVHSAPRRSAQEVATTPRQPPRARHVRQTGLLPAPPARGAEPWRRHAERSQGTTRRADHSCVAADAGETRGAAESAQPAVDRSRRRALRRAAGHVRQPACGRQLAPEPLLTPMRQARAFGTRGAHACRRRCWRNPPRRRSGRPAGRGRTAGKKAAGPRSPPIGQRGAPGPASMRRGPGRWLFV